MIHIVSSESKSVTPHPLKLPDNIRGMNGTLLRQLTSLVNLSSINRREFIKRKGLVPVAVVSMDECFSDSFCASCSGEGWALARERDMQTIITGTDKTRWIKSNR